MIRYTFVLFFGLIFIGCEKDTINTSGSSIEKFITPKDENDDPLTGKVYIYKIDTTFYSSFIADPEQSINSGGYSYAYNIDLPNDEYLFQMTTGNKTSSYINKEVTGGFILRWE